MLFDEALPSTGFNPVYLSNVPSWHRHLPFAYDLVAHLKPKQFVELGVHYGDSYFTFCQSVKDHGIECNCHGIDTWKGDHHLRTFRPSMCTFHCNPTAECHRCVSDWIREGLAGKLPKARGYPRWQAGEWRAVGGLWAG